MRDCGIVEPDWRAAEEFPDGDTDQPRIRAHCRCGARAGKGEYQTAIDRLEPVRQYDHAPLAEFWSVYLRGLAYLRLKNTQAAADAFQRSCRGEEKCLSRCLSHCRISGSRVRPCSNQDVDAAKKAYDQFFTLWKDADPSLAPLVEARAEFTPLR